MAIPGSKIIPEEIIPAKEATTFYIKRIEIDFDAKKASFVKIWGNGNGDSFVQVDGPGMYEIKYVEGATFDSIMGLLAVCSYEGKSAYELLVEGLSTL